MRPWSSRPVLTFGKRPKSLHAVLTGDEALRVEAQDDSKTMEELMEVLRNMYGPSIPNDTGTNITDSLEEQFYHLYR